MNVSTLLIAEFSRLGSVMLYRVLANAECPTRLFIQQAGDHRRHGLTFARLARGVVMMLPTHGLGCASYSNEWFGEVGDAIVDVLIPSCRPKAGNIGREWMNHHVALAAE